MQARAALPILTGSAVAGLDRVGSRVTEERIAELRSGGTEVLRLHGGPVVPLPEHIRTAAILALDELHSGDRRPSRGLPELRSAISDSFGAVAPAPFDATRQLLITNGAMHALNIIVRAILEAGDEVLIPTPNYFFGGVVQLARGVPVHVGCDERSAWGWDLEQMAEAVTDRTRAVLISNPTNPTGYLPSRGELAALLELSRAHGLVLVSDESYESFVYDPPFTSLLELDGWVSNGIVVRSMSKSYALANWRVGCIAASAELTDALTKVLEWDCLHCGYVAQRVAHAAVTGPQEWLDEVRAGLRRNRELALGAISRSQWLRAAPPPAGPFLFLDVTAVEDETGRSGADVLLERGIPAVDGECFESPGHARLPFGGDRPTLDRLVELLVSFDPRS